MKSILVTGGAGFIGSNFLPYFLEKYSEYFLVNLDLLTYAGNLQNLAEIPQNANYKFIKGDICDKNLVEKIFADFEISAVINFAAESHVDNSIKNPGIFVDTNIKGVYTLLETARKFWLKRPFEAKQNFENARFHQISTDEVYGSLGESGYFNETTPYAPNSPYSASKASADMLVRAYFHTFGLNSVITNCSNNYGPKQHDEKLIPTIIRSCVMGKKIPIYGDGKNIRDWLFVLDHCRGIDLAFHKGKNGENYNIGTNNEKTNLEIVNVICEIIDEILPRNESYKNLLSFVADRPGHDRRYAIDASKIKNELGFKANESFKSGIKKTILWYLKEYGVKF